MKKTFNKLRDCLTSKSLLLHFDDDKHVYLTINTSIMGLGSPK